MPSMAAVMASGPEVKSMVSRFTLMLGYFSLNASMIDVYKRQPAAQYLGLQLKIEYNGLSVRLVQPVHFQQSTDERLLVCEDLCGGGTHQRARVDLSLIHI